MSEQVLSQEEIDALLSAMDKGEVDLEEKEQEGEAVLYDLTSQSRMLLDQFYALEEVYDKLKELLNSSLSTSLQQPVEVEFVSTEMVKFGEFMQSFSNPTGLNIFSMDPLIGSALLAVEPNLVFSLIDCMFGGKGETLKQVREFTLIEQRMLGRFAREVLENLEKAWSIVHPIKTSLKKTETKPEFIHMVDPGDLVIAVVFSISGEEFTGNIYFCIPYLMLDPIKDKLSSRSLREPETENPWNSRLRELLKAATVEITAELGRINNCTVRDLINLHAGDLLKMNTGPQYPVTILVENQPKFLGFPGIANGSRAVRITTLFPQTGGANNHANSG